MDKKEESLPFTLKLANGKEMSFKYASDMAEWYTKQKEVKKKGKKKKKENTLSYLKDEKE